MEITLQKFFGSLYNGEAVKTFFAFKNPKENFLPYGKYLREASVKSVSITGEHDEYFMPNLSHGVVAGKLGITDKSIYRCYALFLDFDEGQQIPEKFHIPPSAIVKREDNKACHVYFFIHPTEDVEKWKQTQERLIAYYRSDTNIKNPSRWMRIPGSTRYKQKEDPEQKPLKYNITKCDNVRYSLEQLAASIPAPKKDSDRSWLNESPESLLKIAVNTIKNAPKGERNSALNLWAGRVYLQFAEDKQEEITCVLTDAALSTGLENDEISSALNSAKKYAKENESEKRGRPRKSRQAMELLKKYPLCRYKQDRFMIRDNQALLIGSQAYKEFVSGEYFKATGDPLTSVQLDEVSSIHKAHAGEAEERQVYIRTATPTSAKTYIDLNDGKNTIIEVDTEGWRVSHNPPVIFKRPLNMGTLPFPESDGTIELLREIFNLERQEDFPVIVAALAYILRGRPENRGSYPIVVATGIEGSAKTTFMKVVKNLIDPGTPETRTPPNDIKDLFIAANNGLVLSLDNISYINREMSDALCSLTTGGGFARKKNYTDDEEQIFDLCRPILLNGISFDRAPDLLSRSLIIELRAIPPKDRKAEDEIWERVENCRASVFGGLLSLISGAMRQEQAVKKENYLLPRLADLGRFSFALERGNGWEEGKIASALNSTYNAALADNAEGHPLFPIVINIVHEKGSWRGSATDLFNEVNKRLTDDTVRRLNLWPKTVETLAKTIKRNYNVFASKGIRVNQTRSNGERRWELSTSDGKPFPASRGKTLSI
jgi:hypothetical protein